MADKVDIAEALRNAPEIDGDKIVRVLGAALSKGLGVKAEVTDVKIMGGVISVTFSMTLSDFRIKEPR